MKRDYTDGIKTDVDFFTGFEVETTPAHGLLTLFVVGTPDPYKIINLYHQYHCEHIYLGANQSFSILNSKDENCWDQWYNMTKTLLEQDMLVTLDFDLRYVNVIQSSGLCEYNNFIPQISVKIPNIRNLNYNATLKIDDTDFKATNPGVWCHRLHDLQAIEKFTSWNEYGKDNPHYE